MFAEPDSRRRIECGQAGRKSYAAKLVGNLRSQLRDRMLAASRTADSSLHKKLYEFFMVDTSQCALETYLNSPYPQLRCAGSTINPEP